MLTNFWTDITFGNNFQVSQTTALVVTISAVMPHTLQKINIYGNGNVEKCGACQPFIHTLGVVMHEANTSLGFYMLINHRDQHINYFTGISKAQTDGQKWLFQDIACLILQYHFHFDHFCTNSKDLYAQWNHLRNKHQVWSESVTVRPQTTTGNALQYWQTSVSIRHWVNGVQSAQKPDCLTKKKHIWPWHVPFIKLCSSDPPSLTMPPK